MIIIIILLNSTSYKILKTFKGIALLDDRSNYVILNRLDNYLFIKGGKTTNDISKISSPEMNKPIPGSRKLYKIIL